MLPQAVLRIITIILVFHFTFFEWYPVVNDVKKAYAQTTDAEFNAALDDAKSVGSDLVTGFNPDNLNQTLQDKQLGTADTITPQIGDAQSQQAAYENYYSNPADMNSAPGNDAGDFVNDSYDTRPKYELTNDNVFGNKCLQTDTEGNCTMWSASADLISSTYKDCEKVVIPEYDDPPTQQTCSAERNIQTVPCETRTFVNIQTETFTAPCNTIDVNYQPNQIYAVCRDYYDYYKEYIGTGEDRDDCSCGNHGGALCDGARPANYSVVSSAPAGSRYLGTSYENFRDRDKKSGWDDCTSDRYRYYTKYRNSVVERTFLQYDSPCGANLEQWAQECTVYHLEQCDPAGNNCVVSIQDGESTGDEPDFTYLTKVSQGTSTLDNCSGCTPDYEWDSDGGYDLVGYDCPSFECTSGICPSDSAVKPTPTPSSVKIGEGINTLDYQCMNDVPIYDNWGDVVGYEPVRREIETFYYYRDPRVCNNSSGSIENYLICMKYYTVSIDSGGGLRTLSETPVVEQSTTGEYGNTLYWTRVYGGPDVKPFLNNWYSRVTFKCGEENGTCQPLIDQGCVLYSHKCLDSNCDEIEYTYNCGGTGAVTDYNVAYNCVGEIKCLGTECKDASYEANTDFAAAAAAMEVFNQYRVDATETEIFPGEDQSCQSSPEDCCKAPDSGISMGDYIEAGRNAITAYTYATEGTAATWAAYADAFTYATTMGESGTLSGLVGVTSSSGSVNTVVSQEVLSSMGEEALSQAGMDVVYESGGNAVVSTSSSTMVSALATIATVVAVAMVIYAIAKFIYDYIYQCTEDDILTSTKLGLRVCHEVGEKCVSEALGVCVKKETVYCCFNSLLARVLHEQARGQIAKGWGDEYSPDCSGFSPGELSQIDFSLVDLSEYMQYVTHDTEISPEKTQEIIDRTKQQIQDKYNNDQ